LNAFEGLAGVTLVPIPVEQQVAGDEMAKQLLDKYRRSKNDRICNVKEGCDADTL
jgi:hypothetical protein